MRKREFRDFGIMVILVDSKPTDFNIETSSL